ncbi:calmodulin-4-like [Rattus rattus]|uniref:calmodulin-4-like n=1 Tax=Rattus rattus TaxID=10117 RepID=UPI0013F32A32|nr:calmodulin-4-like [Rattus rattus]
MSHGFTKEQVAELHQAFDSVDKNKDGRINVQELGDVMKQMGKNMPEKDLKALISRVDTDGDGTISFEEFLTAMEKYKKGSKEELQAVFRVFDQNGDGYITMDELKQGLSQMGETLSEEELNDMIRVADADQDGKVNYEEFLRVFLEK